jgi:hypothetical protein
MPTIRKVCEALERLREREKGLCLRAARHVHTGSPQTATELLQHAQRLARAHDRLQARIYSTKLDGSHREEQSGE